MSKNFFRLFSTSAAALRSVGAVQVRQEIFEAMRKAYNEQNQYAQAYFKNQKIDISQVRSDHTAIRTNSIKGMLNAGRLFYALEMEGHEDAKTKGFKAALEKAITTGDTSALEKVEWPYAFADKALRSTHFDIADKPIEKGIQQKIFVSTIDPNVFAEESVKKVIAEDQKYFANDFSSRGKELISKLEKDGSLEEEETSELVKDWMDVFSKRQIPMKLSTFNAIKTATLSEEIKNPLPVIAAIGVGFSGVRNHHTPMVGYEIAELPAKLAAIGVPPGSPPVQFDGPIVQTSSQGIPQQMEYIDDSNPDNQKTINSILAKEIDASAKRQELEQLGVIKAMTVNHEYVEYIKRAQYAKVKIDGKEATIPVWVREDGKCYSAMRDHQDYEGLKAGKYKNGFDSYKKEVVLRELLVDDQGQPVLAPGFTANNATNIFLGTSLEEGKDKKPSASVALSFVQPAIDGKEVSAGRGSK